MRINAGIRSIYYTMSRESNEWWILTGFLPFLHINLMAFDQLDNELIVIYRDIIIHFVFLFPFVVQFPEFLRQET